MSNRALVILCLLTTLFILYLWHIDTSHAATAGKSGRPAAAEQTIQIKLRDLEALIPRSSDKEILARLRAIEERLTAIEAKLPPAPLPAPAPLGGAR